MGGFARESTEFDSDGLVLRGYVYFPESPQGEYPALVMSHGWGATLRMGLESYAERFAAAGFAVLVYDNPNIGQSDGEPRFEINPWVRARATRDAVTHASSHPHVDAERIAIWGDSGDAERVLLNAAIDERVKAVISYNPTSGNEVPVDAPDPSVVAEIERLMEADALPTEMESTFGPGPVVSDDPSVGSMSPSPQAFRWFFEYGGRHGSGWKNEWTYAINATHTAYSPYDCLPAVKVPVLMVKGRDDEVEWCNPAAQRHALSQISGHTIWHEIDGGHFGALYMDSPEFEDAIGAQINFLTDSLNPAHSRRPA